jgi:predicted ferric reductase
MELTGPDIASGPGRLANYTADRARTLRAGSVVAIFWTAVVLNGAAMFWVWLRDGGITNVNSAPDLWTSAGRVTGLLGAYLLLLQVLLLARLPPLERSVGFDRLSVWHRRNAKVVLGLVVAHVVLITLGYAGTIHVSLFSEYSDFLSSYPGMITATVGTGLMIAIFVSSLVIVRRRLRYESWYALHLFTYASIYLAYLHQIPSGNEFVASTVQSDWWLSLYIASAVLLIVFRFARPGIRMWRHRLRVVAVERESPTAVSIWLEGSKLEALGAQPGQFMLWRFMTKGRWWQSHPFSLSAVPTDSRLRITVRAAGDFSAGLAEVPVGTLVLAEGPYGRFVGSRRHRQRVTLIGGGIGISPLRALLEEMTAPPGFITVIHRNMSAQDRALAEEVDRLARERGAVVHHVIGDHRDPDAADQLSPAHLRELVPHIEDSDVFLCGPPAMMDNTHNSLIAAGVPSSQIHSERFALAM